MVYNPPRGESLRFFVYTGLLLPWYYQVLPGTTKYYLVLPCTTWYYFSTTLYYLSTTWYYKVLPVTTKYYLVLLYYYLVRP